MLLVYIMTVLVNGSERFGTSACVDFGILLTLIVTASDCKK